MTQVEQIEIPLSKKKYITCLPKKAKMSSEYKL